MHMKFGLMVCGNTDNIGDDIQSYAASRFLPHIDFYIDREKLSSFCGDNDNQQVAVIMNGWYMYNKFHWPPSPYIHPLYVSMHISQNDYYGIGTKFLDGIGGECLKKYEPIGARDSDTKKIFEMKGIKSYISGCLTLTINKFDNVDKTDNVYLVDVEENDAIRIKELYPNENYVNITHTVDYGNNYVEYDKRMLEVEKLLKKYQGAKCVITSRLHCALPCLALGVPVLLIYKNEYKDRMEDFLPYLHTTSTEEIKYNSIKFNISNPPDNNNEYIEISEKLRKICSEFVLNCENQRLECSKIEFYKIMDWQERLVNSSELIFRSKLVENANWCKKLQQGKDWLEDECNKLKEENEKLHNWCNEQQEEKDWLESECKRLKKENEKLHKWCDEQQEGKDWLENECNKLKEENETLHKWCDEQQEGKDWLEAQWKAKCDECDEFNNMINSNNDNNN